MIAIQVLLIFAIVFIFLRFLASRDSSSTQAWKKILLLGFTFAAVAVVISPSLLNRLANLLGVGRGADLLLYALTVAFIFGQINTYLKEKEEERKIVLLARKIAISEAMQNKHNKKWVDLSGDTE
jgi:hypothetical protein